MFVKRASQSGFLHALPQRLDIARPVMRVTLQRVLHL